MIIRRIIDALFRRRAPQYRGWQDVGWLDEAWEMATPKPEATAKDTVFGIPVQLAPRVPRGEVWVESNEWPQIFTADRALLISGIPSWAISGTERVVIPAGDTGEDWKPLDGTGHGTPVPGHEYRRNGREVQIRKALPDFPSLGLYADGDRS